MAITYQSEALFPEDFVDILRRSGLADRRPVDDPETIRGMVEGAGLTITARDGLKLVGVARSVTDFASCCYLSDLAVDRDYRGRGIGAELVRRTREAASERVSLLLLLSAPDAMDFDPDAGGMAPVTDGFILKGAGQPH